MKQFKKNIKGTEYAVTQMDAFSALEIQTDIIELLGEQATFMFSAGSGNQSQDIITAFLKKFNAKKVQEIIKKLFEKNVFVCKNNLTVPIDFAQHFCGKLDEAWECAAFILEVNLGMGKSQESDLNTIEKV